jgi:predicted PurR-regulated permease PerM
VSAQISQGLDTIEARLSDAFGNDTTSSTRAARDDGGDALGFLLHGAVSVASTAFTVVSTLLLALLVVYYYLRDGAVLWGWVLGLSGDEAPLVDRVGRVMWTRISGFMRGTATVALVDAAGIGLGALVLRVPYPGAIAVTTFLFAFIPYYGAVAAGAIACLLAVADGGLDTGLAMLLVVLAVQQLEANVLQPVLIGRSVQLHPLVVGLGVVAGGAIAGVVGMFLSVPLTAAVVGGLQELGAAGVFTRRRAGRSDTATA